MEWDGGSVEWDGAVWSDRQCVVRGVWSGMGAVWSDRQCVVRGMWSGMGAVWSGVMWRGSVSSRVKWGTTKEY